MSVDYKFKAGFGFKISEQDLQKFDPSNDDIYEVVHQVEQSVGEKVVIERMGNLILKEEHFYVFYKPSYYEASRYDEIPPASISDFVMFEAFGALNEVLYLLKLDYATKFVFIAGMEVS